MRYRIIPPDAHDAQYEVYRAISKRFYHTDRGICSLSLLTVICDSVGLFRKFWRNKNI